MIRPANTVKYMQSGFKKYLLLAVVCTIVTVFAALLAALSGIQVNSLRKAQEAAMTSNSEDQKQRSATSSRLIEKLKQQLTSSQEQLMAEKQNVKNLMNKVDDMERQLSAAEAKLHSQETVLPTPEETEEPPAPSPSENTTESAPSD